MTVGSPILRNPPMHRIYMKLRENLTNVMENSDGKSIFHLLLEDKNYVTMKVVIKSLNSSSKGLHNTSHTGMYIIVCIYIHMYAYNVNPGSKKYGLFIKGYSSNSHFI